MISHLSLGSKLENIHFSRSNVFYVSGQGWNSSAVNKVLVCAEAHSGLAHALADGSCSVAIKVMIWLALHASHSDLPLSNCRCAQYVGLVEWMF